MLRSPATLNRTAVHPSSEMKQPTTRQLLPPPTASGCFPAPLPFPRKRRTVASSVRLFKV